jgi:predicted flap endonuclease-1-like 5' DNA nuclease
MNVLSQPAVVKLSILLIVILGIVLIAVAVYMLAASQSALFSITPPQILSVGTFCLVFGLALLFIVGRTSRPIRAIGLLMTALGLTGTALVAIYGNLNPDSLLLGFNPLLVFGAACFYLVSGVVVLLLSRTEVEPFAPVPQIQPPASPVPLVHTEVEPPAPAVHTQPPQIQLEFPPTLSTAPKPQTDLTAIRGVTPHIQDALNRAGIHTYAQLSKTPFEVLYRIVEVENNIRIIGDATTWPRQAKYLMAGDVARLKAYQDRMFEDDEPEG